MKTKFTTATAIVLVMATGAYAQSNTAVVVQGYATQASDDNEGLIDQSGGLSNTAKATQLGDDNKLTVTQSGNGNRAGAHLQKSGLDPYSGASGYNYITQNGDNNGLTITQSANGNIVAIDGSFTQTGNFNLATVNQIGKSSAGNRLNSVSQTDSTGNAAALTNSLVVEQSGATPGDYAGTGIGGSDYNYTSNLVAAVSQTWDGTTAVANTLTIKQSGGVYGRGNVVTSAVQNGSGNAASVTQDGYGNRVALLSQVGHTNTATLTFDGSLNGAAGFGTGSASTVAAGNGLIQGQAIQVGNSNSVSYDVLGDGNLFSFKQTEDGNAITGIVIGDSNEVAILQTGNSNDSFVQQMGSSNNIGISQ